MKKIIITSIIVSLLLPTVTHTYASDEPGLRIENKCDEKYPKSSRDDYNRPQYQLAYDRCMAAFSTYDESLEELLKIMENVTQNQSLGELEKADKLLEIMANTIETHGEGLIGLVDKSNALDKIYIYRKNVQGKINEIKISNIPKQYITFINSSTGTTNSGSITTNTQEVTCKKGYTKNKKTGKCRKIIQTKKKEVTQ